MERATVEQRNICVRDAVGESGDESDDVAAFILYRQDDLITAGEVGSPHKEALKVVGGYVCQGICVLDHGAAFQSFHRLHPK